MNVDAWQLESIYIGSFQTQKCGCPYSRTIINAVYELIMDYDSVGRRVAANSRSKAALVSSPLRCFRSETQPVTFDTISRAATLGVLIFRFADRAATASVFFTILIFVLSIMLILPPC